MEDDSTLGELSPRRGRSSSSDASTAHATPPAHQGRTLRSRSVSGNSGARFSPYHYSPPQTSSYGRSTRTRRATTTSLSVSGVQTGSFLPDQQMQSSSSPPPTAATSRKRTRPATLLPIPIPVPNLTKKSRGRGVPTIATLEMTGRGRGGQTFSEDDYTESGKRRNGARLYTCKVPGCGKCFARGEHLKRHVRSIHTYEKRASDLSFSSSHPDADALMSTQRTSAHILVVGKTSAVTITLANTCECTRTTCRPRTPEGTEHNHLCDRSIHTLNFWSSSS
jgi:uncharacterized C2H2 Zn-finger protein